MAFSDEDLMDYADGVLDEHTTAKIDQAIEDDPSLLDRIEEFRSSFAMAAIADDFAQSTVPSLAEMEEAIAARERGAVVPEKAYGLLEALRARIMVVLVSLSLTFAGGVAATMGFVAWRVQQAVVSFQFPAVAVVRHGLKTRGATKGQDTSKYASDPIWYGKGP